LKRVYVLCPYVKPSKKAGPPNAYNWIIIFRHNLKSTNIRILKFSIQCPLMENITMSKIKETFTYLSWRLEHEGVSSNQCRTNLWDS
jgi:hypothetical protein